ncbi:MAG: methyltransferase domain-containing protein, partial [Thermoanaerobaculia bacterium]
MLRNPKPRTEFRLVGDRLALFHSADDHDRYWEEYWESFDYESLSASVGIPALGELASVFGQYLPRGELVLEAGCGAGRIMAALQAEGFKVLGVERSVNVVASVNRNAAFLNVRQGDVEHLDLEGGTVGSYVSLGVIEHSVNGPDGALREAARVLQPGGIAFVSVPFLNPLRARHLQHLSQAGTHDLSFHQFYFSREQLNQHLERAGFVVRDHLPYAVAAFMTREHP